MADDWITNFFDKSRIVSDGDMQQLWARILAGEANAPGAFAKRTINLVADLDKSDAELFMCLCGFCWMIGDLVPLAFDVNDEVYRRNSISFNALTHLESLGLVRFDDFAGFAKLRVPKQITPYFHFKLHLRIFGCSSASMFIGV